MHSGLEGRICLSEVPSATGVERKKRQRRIKPIRAHAAASSKQAAREATSRFHALLQQEHRLQATLETTAKRVRMAPAATAADPSATPESVEAQLRAIRADIEAMGGRRAYQAASQLNTREFRTSRIVTSTLTALGLRPSSGKPLPRVLEIGAINPDLQRVRWLSTRAIDILASAPGVEQRDFFTLRPPCISPVALSGAETVKDGPFDVIVCSMVLNCVPTAAARGRMLVMCRDLLRDAPRPDDVAAAESTTESCKPCASATFRSGPRGSKRGLAVPLLAGLGPAAEVVWKGRGLLVLTLPRRCVDKSPFTTKQSLEAACRLCGLETIGRRESASIMTWLLAVMPPDQPRLGLSILEPRAAAPVLRGSSSTPEGVPSPAGVAEPTGVVQVGRARSELPASAVERTLAAPASLDEPPKPVRRLPASARAEKTDFAVCFRVVGR